jgi:hypothetical protein
VLAVLLSFEVEPVVEPVDATELPVLVVSVELLGLVLAVEEDVGEVEALALVLGGVEEPSA